MREITESLTDRVTAEIQPLDIGADGGEGTRFPRVYLQAQLHGNETTGPLVLRRLAERYQDSGAPVPLRIVRNANPFSWDSYAEAGEGRISRPGEHNWNRIFGSIPDVSASGRGVSAEQALSRRLWQLSLDYDVIIDLHTPEFGWPHIYVSELSTGLVTFSDLPHVVYGAPISPAFDEAHARHSLSENLGKRVATLELPSHTMITSEIVGEWEKRIHEELTALRVERTSNRIPPIRGQMFDLLPGITGIAEAVAEPAKACPAGATVLRVLSRQGDWEDLVAPVECVPLCYRRRTIVKAGFWAVRAIAIE